MKLQAPLYPLPAAAAPAAPAALAAFAVAAAAAAAAAAAEESCVAAAGASPGGPQEDCPPGETLEALLAALLLHPAAVPDAVAVAVAVEQQQQKGPCSLRQETAERRLEAAASRESCNPIPLNLQIHQRHKGRYSLQQHQQQQQTAAATAAAAT